MPIRLADLAELLGVSKQRAHQLAAEKGSLDLDTFPTAPASGGQT